MLVLFEEEHMKKLTIAAVAVLVVALLALAACSSGSKDLSNSKYVGTWKATELSLGENTGALEEEWTITLKGDGSGTSVGPDSNESFTWEPTSNGFKTKGDIKLTFVDDGDNIKTKVIGVDIHFVRQP